MTLLRFGVTGSYGCVLGRRFTCRCYVLIVLFVVVSHVVGCRAEGGCMLDAQRLLMHFSVLRASSVLLFGVVVGVK